MDRTQRCELLARLSDAELERLGSLVVDASRTGVVVQQGPTAGMIMARVVEGARGETFNLGEVLVTECHVAVGPHEGWSMLIGSRPQGAFWAAAIDAALAGGYPHEDRLDTALQHLIALKDEALTLERARLAETIVRFETQ